MSGLTAALHCRAGAVMARSRIFPSQPRVYPWRPLSQEAKKSEDKARPLSPKEEEAQEEAKEAAHLKATKEYVDSLPPPADPWVARRKTIETPHTRSEHVVCCEVLCCVLCVVYRWYDLI